MAHDRESSRPSLADAIDLLDLVRGAEDGARVSTEAPAPAPAPAPLARAEEFVEVGDEAVDAPPSLPPSKVIVSPAPARMTTRSVTKRVPSIDPEAKTPLLPFAVFFAVAAASVYLFVTLSPPDAKPGVRSGPEAADLQLERGTE